MMVVGVAGTTVLGGFDKFEEISKVCKEHDMWFHVDAAWGASAFFSDRLRYLVKGAELSDSVSLCFHKNLGVS